MYRPFWSKVVLVKEGRELFPHYDLCGMHIPAGRIIKQQRTTKCDNNTQMR